MSNPNHLDDLREDNDIIDSVLTKLDTISYALSVAGNEKLSDDLRFIMGKILKSIELFNTAHSKIFKDSVKQSFENSGNIVKACLAMNELNSNKED